MHRWTGQRCAARALALLAVLIGGAIAAAIILVNTLMG